MAFQSRQPLAKAVGLAFSFLHRTQAPLQFGISLNQLVHLVGLDLDHC